MNAVHGGVPQEEMNKLFDIVDREHDGRLDLNEFMLYMSNWKRHIMPRDRILNTFAAYDRSDLTTEGKYPLTKEEAEEFCKLATPNGEHFFNYEDFVDFMLSHIEQTPDGDSRKKSHLNLLSLAK
eukprot:g896.t1